MKTFLTVGLVLGCSLAARADFTYTSTTTMTGGMFASMAGQKPTVTKQLLKGDKMMTVSSDSTMIMDFGAQTVTTIEHGKKSYKVTSFAELMKPAADTKFDVAIDVKETGATKSINGFKARQVIMSLDVDSPQSPGAKMKMTMDMWITSDVPGSAELKSFYDRNAARFPWAAMGGKQQAHMANLAKKMASLGGIPLVQVMKMGGGEQAAQMKSQMAGACAQIEDMKKKGGPGAAMAEKMAAQMGCGGGAAGGGSLMEATTESSGFSTASIAASEFAVPAGYKAETK